MEDRLKEIREQQKAAWNKFSPGWKKWDELNMDFLKPIGDEIIRLIHPNEEDVILDVAAGTGEPGLTIATMLNGGKVILIDLSEDMLEIARINALNRGIENVETLSCDVCELPFENDSIDAISCRFGFMFFPDMLLAAKEMLRVLKSNGRIAVSVWNVPEKNFWVTAIMEVIRKNIELPVPPVGSPWIFRCAKDGLITDLFAQAGYRNIIQNEISTKQNFRTSEVYWNMMTEVVSPVVTALAKVDESLKEKIKREVYQVLNEKYPDGNVVIDSSAFVIYAEK